MNRISIEVTKWFYANIFLIALVLFFLNLWEVEFNEYPHAEITIFGNNNETIWEKHLFCPRWVSENYDNKLEEVSFDFYNDTSYCPNSNKWINPKENRVIYYIGYEIILTDISEYKEEIKVKIVNSEKSFILFKGEDLSIKISNLFSS